MVSNFSYTFDGNGNILTATDAVSGEIITYTYDDLNQLVGAVYGDGRVESYSYDATGNILTFHNGITSHTYSYENSWLDLLTAVDGVAFSYDAIGNPIGYYNGTSYIMSWTDGRKLSSVTSGGNTTGYLYDSDGVRIRKTNADGSYVLYMVAGGTAIGEKHYDSSSAVTKYLRYTFDENGSICGYSTSTDGTSWADYYFIRNLQGDVLQVFRESDNVIVAEYSYDSWGNILSATGEKAEENPFRYRGYYYDEETGFYATGTRYYDPEIGRFINADDIAYLGADGTPLSYNLFAYCMNNPVNRFDDNGNWSLPNWAKIVVGVAAIGIGVGATVLTGGAALPALIVGVKTALTVGVISAATSGGITAFSSILSGDSAQIVLEKTAKSAVDGFCDGFMTGGITAGASMTTGALIKNCSGIKLGKTPNPNHGRVDIGYGSSSPNGGGTLVSFNNANGSSRFRIDVDSLNSLHVHYGKTNKLRKIHRTGLVNGFMGGLTGVWSEYH